MLSQAFVPAPTPSEAIIKTTSQSFVRIKNRIPLVRSSSEMVVRCTGSSPKAILAMQDKIPLSTRGVQTSRQRTLAPNPQSQSFSRKLRILFADFPYLLCSIIIVQRRRTWRPDAVMGATWGVNESVLLLGQSGAQRTPRKTRCFYPQVNPISRVKGKKKRQPFPGLPPVWLNSFTLRYSIRVRVGALRDRQPMPNCCYENPKNHQISRASIAPPKC